MSRRPTPGAAFNRLAARTARRLLSWSAARVDGAERTWIEALAAELDEIEGGGKQLVWAVGGLRLVWRGGRRQLVSRAYRFSPMVFVILGVVLVAWLAVSLAQQYVLLAMGLGALTGIGALLVVPVLRVMVQDSSEVVRTRLAARQRNQERVRHAWSQPALVAGAACVAALLGLGLALHAAVDQLLAQGPATVGVVASTADRGAVEAALRHLPGTARQDGYLTTLVNPLAVNGVPLAQVAPGSPISCPPQYIGPNCQTPTEQQRAQFVQGVADKYTSIQGFDLAHGQLPDITNFDDGRRLAAGDADTSNVMVAANCPRDTCGDYIPDNGDLVSVQSLVTGQTIQLRIVGKYWVEDGQPIPLFGMVLADESVVRALTGGAPSYAYGLRIGATQRQTLFAQLRAVAPSAQLYDFTRLGADVWSVPGVPGVPGYTDFTDPVTADFNFTGDHAGLIGAVVLLATLLASIPIVVTRETWALARARRKPSATLDT